MRRLSIIVIALLVASSCGDDSSESAETTTPTTATSMSTTAEVPESTVTTTEPPTSSSTTTSPEPPADLDYTVEQAERFIGTTAPNRTFADPEGEADTEGWFHPWGPWPEGDGWQLVLSRRMPPGPPGSDWDADLVMVIDDATGTVTDALLITGDSIGDVATIGLSCEGTKPAILVDRNETAVRAWQVAAVSLALVEVDPSGLSDAEIESACLNAL